VTALQAYRDDGPLAEWVLGRLAPADAGRADRHPLAWIVPPLLRALEYGFLIALTALVEPDALPFCFAFLGVLAYHHYDIVYRLRSRQAEPPTWVGAGGGGWDGRILVASVLALAGVLGLGLLAAAGALALVWATESVSSWLRFVRTPQAGARRYWGEEVE
jgi:hypothetical protein